MKIEYKPTPKQHLLWELINDEETSQILYGGGVGSGKSYGICAIITLLCLTKEGIRIGLARKNLTTLKKTTLISLFEVFNDFKLEVDEHYNYNQQSGTIRFKNGSEVILVDLDFYPGDSLYQRLGGLLLTMAVVDEVGELSEENGYNILASRCGRWANDSLGIKPMIVSTCNPSSNFIKEKFYEPYVKGNLEPHLKFIPALLTDNPNLGASYRKNLELSLDLVSKKRLLDGDWNYSDNDLDLFTIGDIENMYIKRENEDNTLYLSVDVAVDRDSTIGIVWKGLEIVDIIEAERNIPNNIFIKDTLSKYNISNKNCIIDSSGVGNDLKRQIVGSQEFFGNARCIGSKKTNYKNLRDQCYFKLSELVYEGKVYISTNKQKERLKRELLSIRRSEVILNRVEVMNKKELKRILQASPDIIDAMMMRMVFELKGKVKKQF